MSKTKKRDYLKNAKQLKDFLHCHRALWKKNSDLSRLAKKTLLELIEDQPSPSEYFDGMNTDPYLVIEDYYSTDDACDIGVLWDKKWKNIIATQLVNTPLITLFNVNPINDANEKKQSRKRVKKSKK